MIHLLLKSFQNAFRCHSVRQRFTVLALGLLSGQAAHAQQEVYVDKFTGTAHVAIPLSTSSIQGVSVSLGLNYTASGMRVNDTGTFLGVGWALTGAPVITREVRDMPDDIDWTTPPNIPGSPPRQFRYGWMHPSVRQWITPLTTPAAQAWYVPCFSNESALSAAVNEFSSGFSDGSRPMYDSEPDVFSYSLPGHSGKFVIDNKPNDSSRPYVFRTIPYDDIEIICVPEDFILTDGTNPGTGRSFGYFGGKLGHFTIKTSDGITYDFNARNCDLMSKSLGASAASASGRQPVPAYFKKQYYQLLYQYGTVYTIPGLPPECPQPVYAAAWNVSTITNTVGEVLRFTYAKPTFYEWPTAAVQESDEFTDARTSARTRGFKWKYLSTKSLLKSISSPATKTSFLLGGIGSTQYLDRVNVASSFDSTENLANFLFRYRIIQTDDGVRQTGQSPAWLARSFELINDGNNSGVFYNRPDLYNRRFLTNISVVDHDAGQPGYYFSYKNLPTHTDRLDEFPPAGCVEQDYLGYCKRSINSYNPNTLNIFVYPSLFSRQTLDAVPGSPYRLFASASSTLSGTDSGQTTGNDVTPVSDNASDFNTQVLRGILTDFVLPSRARYRFAYEPHFLLDSIANRGFVGGGVRIKEIELRDHLTGVTEVRSYGYESTQPDPNNAGQFLSSGRLLRQPQFAFAVPPVSGPAVVNSSAAQIVSNTVYSRDNMNRDPFEQRSLGYGRVTENVLGRGRTITTYAMTGTADVAQQGNGDLWRRSLVRYAAANVSGGPNTNPATLQRIARCAPGYNQYPFPPDANLDFRRGLTLRVEHQANDAPSGAPAAWRAVQRTDYTYGFNDNRPGVAVVGMCYDWLTSDIIAYAPYRLLTNFSYVLKETKTTVFSQAAAASAWSGYMSSYTRYGYNREGMRASVATQQSTTGTIYRTRYKYLSDYDYASAQPLGPTFAAQAYRYRNEGRRNDLVETVSEIITPATGGAGRQQRITGASLNTFRLVPNAVATGPQVTCGYQAWGWQAAPGLAVGSPEYIADSVMVVTEGQPLVTDLRRQPRFQLGSSVVEVSAKQVALAVESPAGRQRSGIVLGYSQRLPVLEVANARGSETRFSNFEPSQRDEDLEFGFEASNSSAMLRFDDPRNSHTGTGYLALTEPAQFARASLPIVPASTTLPVSDVQALAPSAYRLTFWARPGATGTGSVRVVLSSGSTATTLLQTPLGVRSRWKLYEVLVSVAGIPTGSRNDYLLKLSGSAGTVLLDDVLLLPVGAQAVSTTYAGPLGGKTSQIDAAGRTTYFEHDAAMQPRLVRDQNRDVVQRIERVAGGVAIAAVPTSVCPQGMSLNAVVPQPTEYVEQVEVALSIVNACPSFVTATRWDFGDNRPAADLWMGGTHTYALTTTPQTKQVRVELTTAQGPVFLVQNVNLPAAILEPTLCKTGLAIYRPCAPRASDYFASTCNPGSPAYPSGGPTGRLTEFKIIIPRLYANETVTYSWSVRGAGAMWNNFLLGTNPPIRTGSGTLPGNIAPYMLLNYNSNSLLIDGSYMNEIQLNCRAAFPNRPGAPTFDIGPMTVDFTAVGCN